MQNEWVHQPQIFLSTQLAGSREKHFAQAAVLLSAIFFFAAAPFAKIPLVQVPVFIPVYVAFLVICDLITAVILFGQFSFLRSRALWVLASGYLFTAFIVFAYAIIFPGFFSSTGLLGAGAQTTSAMYMFWHTGFPIAVIIYALLKHKEIHSGDKRQHLHKSALPIFLGVMAVFIVVLGFTVFTTVGHAYIPVFLQDNHTTNLGHIVLFSIWMLSIIALIVLLLQRPHTVLDIWLIVVMCSWLCDIGLAAVFNTGRYDLGWYTGRIYGMLAATFLLIILLTENVAHYAKLAQLSTKLSDANASLEQLATQDGLTGIANRRFFDIYLASQVAIAYRHKRCLSLILCDVDFFKAYNDHYGHQAGDECLKQIAVVLQSCCRRPGDIVARYGGEEFAMILPETELIGAIQIAEAARVAVEQLGIPHAQSAAAPHISISSGAAVLLLTINSTPEQLITASDQVLYEAKRLGRNRTMSGEVSACNKQVTIC